MLCKDNVARQIKKQNPAVRQKKPYGHVDTTVVSGSVAGNVVRLRENMPSDSSFLGTQLTTS